MTRRKIQGPILSFMMTAERPVKRSEIVAAVAGSSSSVSGALNRLESNKVVQNGKNGWAIIDFQEANWLLNNTYHTKHREPQSVRATGPRVVGVIPTSNGALKVGDLLEMVGKLNDGTRLVRTVDTEIIYKLEEV